MSTLLEGKRILLVEDEYYIASDLKRMLSQRGAAPVGPAADLPTGLSLAATEDLDAAVLDVNLGETRSFAIADCLKARGVPYILLTGYDSWSLPARYQDAPRLEKPYFDQKLVDDLERILGSRGAR